MFADDRRMSQSPDDHITGHGGEDQLKQQFELPSFSDVKKSLFEVYGNLSRKETDILRMAYIFMTDKLRGLI
jgi:hypothetical protein